MKTACPRCEGHGNIKSYKHVEGGICFKCAGTGQVAATKTRTRKPKTTGPNVEYCRKEAAAMALYANGHPLLVVTADHPYYCTHAVEIAQKTGAWATL